MSNTLLRILAIPFGHKRISGRRFSPPELGGFILVGMLLIVYTIYATYKERTFLLSGICSIHTAKEPANVLKKFNAEAKTSWISNILNKYQKTIIEDKRQAPIRMVARASVTRKRTYPRKRFKRSRII